MQHDIPSTNISPRLPKTFGWFLIALLMSGAIAYQTIHTESDLSATLNLFVTRFLSIFIEAIPFLLLGSLTSGLIEVFVKTEDILRWLPHNRLGAAIVGICLGFLFPVSEYGVVPVTRRLFTKGVPMSTGVAFLLSAPFMNPIVFASTYIAFGLGTMFIGRLVITALIAMTVAVLMSTFAQPEEVLKPHVINTLGELQDRTFRHQFLRAVTIARDEFFEIGRFLIVGCALAVTMQTIMPQDSLLALGTGSVLSVIVLQIQAFILSIGSTGDSVLALMFVNTFTSGAIISFLTFGSIVDMKSALMFTGVFKRKIIVYLIVLPFLMNLLAGVIINILMGSF